MLPDAVDEGRVLDLLAEWYDRRAGGDEPSADELTDDPRLRAALRARIAAARALDPVAAGSTAGGVSGGTVADRPPDPPGYRLGSEIARGGMGAVYAATDLTLGRQVAVKVLLGAARRDATAAARFAFEARVTGRLPHPNIPPVHALGELPDGGGPFLAMKRIGGATLEALLTARPSPASELPRWVAAFDGVCQAVGFAHARGVVHRDLKPRNVMVGDFAEVQVIDWGLAKDTGDGATPEAGEGPAGAAHRTHAEQVLGTPAYMAPEQARGEAADARADVFALGGVLLTILTGRPPHAGKDVAEVVGRAAAGELDGAFARLDACAADAALERFPR